MTTLTVSTLAKRYGTITAVKDVSFSVSPGEIVGLLGPNGAGKSTTVGMIFGAVIPDSGQITVGDDDLYANPKAAKSKLGIVTQENNLDRDFTARENLLLFASYHNLPTAEAKSRVDELLQQVDLTTHAHKRIDELSGGMCRRLTLARALLGRPGIILLDEPTTGLDPEARQAFWRLIVTEKQAGRAILLTTHYMEEAERLCDRIVLLQHGAIVDSGKPGELIARIAGVGVVEVVGVDPAILKSSLFETEHWMRDFSDGFLVGARNIQGVDKIFEVISSLHPKALTRRSANLNDVFLLLTGEALT